MNRLLLAACLTASVCALAQRDDDAPIPYDDEDNTPKSTAPKKSRKQKRKAEDLREEEEDEQTRDTVESMASVDDPNVGVGAELLSGVALLDGSKAGVDPRYYFGARFTWEFGRLIPDEYLREMFFVDVTWMYAASKDGTAQVNVDTHFHNFTVAPAFALPLGKSIMAAYVQLGAGFDYSNSITQIDASKVTLGGVKGLFQYGVGLRGRPAIVGDGSVRIVFRIEVTRFVRGYMHDMYIGGGIGILF